MVTQERLQIKKKSILDHTQLSMMLLMILKMLWKECYLLSLKKRLLVLQKLEKCYKVSKIGTIAGCMVTEW